MPTFTLLQWFLQHCHLTVTERPLHRLQLHSSLAHSFPTLHYLSHSVPSSILPSLTWSVSSPFPSTLLPSLPHSFLPSLSSALPQSLTPLNLLTTYLPPSLHPCINLSLVPSCIQSLLTLSLPHCLFQSLLPSLTPSIPPCHPFAEFAFLSTNLLQ